MSASIERPTIVVSASSFIKNSALCQLLERTFPRAQIHYVDSHKFHAESSAVAALHDADAWLVGRELVTRSIVSALPKLKVVAKYGVGLDNVDQEACRDRSIEVAWQGGVNSGAVAEHTLGLMLALTRNIARGSRLLSQGQWWKDGGQDLRGQRVGIVGFGHIGERVAELLIAFRCKVRFCDILDKTAKAQALGLEQVTYLELLPWADMITFHVPLTSTTRGMLNARALEMTRAGVRIINTSRGEVIKEADLKQYLTKGHVAGAALDVFESEPLVDKDLYSLESFVGTSHTAGNSREAVWAMGEAAIQGLQKALG